MLTKRIVPILLFDGNYCVQTTQFSSHRRIGPIDQFVNNMANRDVDELCLIDITATKEKRQPNYKKIKSFTEKLFCPVTYGGGVVTQDHVTKLIQECGVDKIAIKTSFSSIYSLAKKFGSQAIVYSCDIYNEKLHGFPTKVRNRIDVLNWLKLIEKEGAGEILLTDINRQGMEKGYNLKLISKASKALNIPLIANGGAGNEKHFIEAIECGANAVAASTLFALRETTPRDAARAVHAAGYPTRLPPMTASHGAS